jgi:hypothetical protein
MGFFCGIRWEMGWIWEGFFFRKSTGKFSNIPAFFKKKKKKSKKITFKTSIFIAKNNPSKTLVLHPTTSFLNHPFCKERGKISTNFLLKSNQKHLRKKKRKTNQKAYFKKAQILLLFSLI